MAWKPGGVIRTTTSVDPGVIRDLSEFRVASFTGYDGSYPTTLVTDHDLETDMVKRVMGRADWIWEEGVDTHVPHCSQMIGTRRCGVVLHIDGVMSGDCGGDHFEDEVEDEDSGIDMVLEVGEDPPLAFPPVYEHTPGAPPHVFTGDPEDSGTWIRIPEHKTVVVTAAAFLWRGATLSILSDGEVLATTTNETNDWSGAVTLCRISGELGDLALVEVTIHGAWRAGSLRMVINGAPWAKSP